MSRSSCNNNRLNHWENLMLSMLTKLRPHVSPRKIRSRASAYTLAAITLLSATSFANATNSGNLIVNGDGETGLCTTDWNAVKTVPGWTVLLGNPSVVCYSIASFSTPSASQNGNAFIAD